ncbi:hypothetical protein PLICRDRAFT_699330, partial [Plicaturopsis crispa FD-325 SS-3]
MQYQFSADNDKVSYRARPSPPGGQKEVGTGWALLSANQPDPSPSSLVVVTNYLDAGIIANLEPNVRSNRPLVVPWYVLKAQGYNGTWTPHHSCACLPSHLDVRLRIGARIRSHDVIALSDLLHFYTSHGVLLASIAYLLTRTPAGRARMLPGALTRTRRCARISGAGLVLKISDRHCEDRKWRPRWHS